jgi:hypothetical protein
MIFEYWFSTFSDFSERSSYSHIPIRYSHYRFYRMLLSNAENSSWTTGQA